MQNPRAGWQELGQFPKEHSMEHSSTQQLYENKTSSSNSFITKILLVDSQ